MEKPLRKYFWCTSDLVLDWLPIGFQTLLAVTYVSVFVFALGAAAHVTDGPDVFLLEACLVV